MPLKRDLINSQQRRRRRAKTTLLVAQEWTGGLPQRAAGNGQNREYQRINNSETAEERAQRLAKREALTLRAFQIAYDNHHPRKSS